MGRRRRTEEAEQDHGGVKDAQPGTLDEQVAALTVKVNTLLAAGRGLEADVRELTHDVTALAQLAGQIFGEPFRSKAQDIVTKRQTGNGRNP